MANSIDNTNRHDDTEAFPEAGGGKSINEAWERMRGSEEEEEESSSANTLETPEGQLDQESDEAAGYISGQGVASSLENTETSFESDGFDDLAEYDEVAGDDPFQDDRSVEKISRSQ
jgi:hypothetical protein